MQDNQSEAQKQQHLYSLYTPYRTQPVAQPGQPAQMPPLQPGQPVYTPQPGQPALLPILQPGPPVVQTPATFQPGQPMQAPVAPAEKVLPVTDKVPNVQAPLWVQHAALPQPGVPLAQPVPHKPKRSGWRTVTIGALVCLTALVFGVGLFSGWTFAHTQANTTTSKAPTTTSAPAVNSSTDSLETAQEAAIAKVEPAVVQIQGTLAQGKSIGSGIIVDNQGDIVTNNHVVDGARSLTVVLNNGNQETAQLVGTDPAHDLAVIRIQPFASMTIAILGDSSQLVVGQEVLAIGNPLGYSGTATAGVVSALNRTAQETNSVSLDGLIQTSAAINPGNSGGALINLQGQVVGIPTLSAINSESDTPANGIGFAIPSNQVHTTITQILGN